MSWIVLLVVGGVIGWLASLIMKTNAQMGLIANVLVGIGGSALGAWAARGLGLAPSGLMVYVVAVAGAVLLIFLLRQIGLFK